MGKRHEILIIDPKSFQLNTEIPKPYLTSFTVFDKEIKTEKALYYTDSVYLDYNQNFFSFTFSAIANHFPEDVQFSYRLKNFDPEWKDGTKRRYAAYTNVPGGEYVFEIHAANNEGITSTEPCQLFIAVAAPWWETLWFRSLAACILAGLIYMIYKYRTQQIRREEHLRRKFERELARVEMGALRAQMNPHFIFNSLNSIDYYIIKNQPEKASDYLQSFSRLIRLILQNSRANQITLHDELEAVRLYIEMESLRFSDQFDYIVKADPEIDLEAIKIPPMLLQPYLENAIWHGLMQKKGERRLELRITQSNGTLQCVIEDNGIGREAAARLRSKTATRRKSFGMQITKDRIAVINKLHGINASVQITDLKDMNGNVEGTRVEVRIPVEGKNA